MSDGGVYVYTLDGVLVDNLSTTGGDITGVTLDEANGVQSNH